MGHLTIENLKQQGKFLHEVSPKQQLAAIRNSLVEHLGELSGQGFILDPLTEDKIDNTELEAVRLLAGGGMYCGPFAATALEGPRAWRRYVPPYTETKILDAFELASEKELWLKYLGLWAYDRHLMGQIVHAVCMLTEILLPRHYQHSFMSPALAAPSYRRAVENRVPPKSTLFIGAFSPLSVVGIYAINQHYLNHSHLTILDIEGGLAAVTAQAYNLPFMISDVRQSGLADHSFELIMTNFLVPAMSDGSDPGEMHSDRQQLLKEAFRLLRPGGQIALVELPIIDYFLDTEAMVQEVTADKQILYTQLAEAGFTGTRVCPARQYAMQYNADFFIRRGPTFGFSHTEVPEGTDERWLITASKP